MSDRGLEMDLLGLGDLRNGSSSPSRDPQPAIAKCEKFVAFFLGRKLFCFPAETVSEVIHPLPVSPLPNARGFVAGIAAFKSEVMVVLDLKTLLKVEDTCLEERPKLILLNTEANRTRFAIAIDAMHELITLTAGESEPDQRPTVPSLTRPINHQERVFYIIDPDALLSEVEKNI